MAIKLDPQREAYLVGSIRQFFAEELDDTIGELKQSAQGYKSMFDSASQQANNTLRDVANFDHSAPNTPPKPSAPEPEPKFIPFEIGLPDTNHENNQ